jgi:hypothetical protein
MDYNQNYLKRRFIDMKEQSVPQKFKKHQQSNRNIDISLFYNERMIENPWKYLKIKE